MGYMTDGLTFNVLREANQRRVPEFRDKQGRICHAPDGSDWKLSGWSNATFGELGEAANIIKKIERGDFTLEQARAHLADELADVAIYLDILAWRADIDLGQAIVDKFNRVSIRVNSRVRLIAGGSDWNLSGVTEADSHE